MTMFTPQHTGCESGSFCYYEQGKSYTKTDEIRPLPLVACFFKITVDTFKYRSKFTWTVPSKKHSSLQISTEDR